MNRGICRNWRQICTKSWRKYENTAKFGHTNTETSCTDDGRNSGAVFLNPRDAKWCAFTRHRRRKVMCLHSSPKRNSAVSSSSPTKKQKCLRLSRFVEHGCLRSLPTKEKLRAFVYHLRWNSGVFAHYQWRNCGVSSFITNEWAAVCLHLLPMNGQRCVFVYHQQWTNIVSPLVMKGGKKTRSRYYVTEPSHD